MREQPGVEATPIEAIRPGDLPAVAALHARCFHEPWRPELIGRITRAPGGFGLLWRNGGEPLGFVLGRSNGARSEVLSLGVAPGERQRGLRTLYLEVAEDNNAALRLYRALGFAQVGRRPRYYARPEAEAVDALTLRRAILPAAAGRTRSFRRAAGPRNVS